MHLHHYSPNKTISHKLWMHRKTAEGQEDNSGIRRLILFVDTGNEAKKICQADARRIELLFIVMLSRLL